MVSEPDRSLCEPASAERVDAADRGVRQWRRRPRGNALARSWIGLGASDDEVGNWSRRGGGAKLDNEIGASAVGAVAIQVDDEIDPPGLITVVGGEEHGLVRAHCSVERGGEVGVEIAGIQAPAGDDRVAVM